LYREFNRAVFYALLNEVFPDRPNKAGPGIFETSQVQSWQRVFGSRPSRVTRVVSDFRQIGWDQGSICQTRCWTRQILIRSNF